MGRGSSTCLSSALRATPEAERVPVLSEAGLIALRMLDDPDMAIEYFAQAADLGISDPLIEGLFELFEQNRNRGRAGDILADLCQAT